MFTVRSSVAYRTYSKNSNFSSFLFCFGYALLLVRKRVDIQASYVDVNKF